MAQKKFVTIRDVAKEAGVSYSSVSLVLNNKASKYNLREETIQNVLDAAKKLGYVRNINADRFRGGMKQNLIGFMVPYLNTPLYSDIVAGLDEELGRQDYFLVIAGVGEKPEHEKDYLEQFIGYRFAGVIDLTQDFRPENYEQLGRVHIPIVFMQTLPEGTRAHFVSFDDQAGARQAAEHLIDEGHKRIGFVLRGSGATMFMSMVEDSRWHGVEEAAAKADGVEAVCASITWKREAIRGWLRENSKQGGCTGVVCEQDFVAMELMAAASEEGIKVPDDLAVVGFDNLELCNYLAPSLTSVDLPRRQLGVELARTMLSLIDGEHDVAKDGYIHRLLEPRLVRRASS